MGEGTAACALTPRNGEVIFDFNGVRRSESNHWHLICLIVSIQARMSGEFVKLHVALTEAGPRLEPGAKAEIEEPVTNGIPAWLV